MTLRQLFPELEVCDLEIFLEKISNSSIYNLFLEIAKKYEQQIPLWKVINFYRDADLSDYDDEVQVTCSLAEHGSGDKHKSARYFKYDRQTGELRPAVYCYKCNRVLTSFWYIYRKERDFRDLDLKGIFLHIWKVWGIDFPRELILDFDPESFYNFEDGTDEKIALAKIFAQAASYRMLKEVDVEEYKKVIVNFYNTVMLENNTQ